MKLVMLFALAASLYAQIGVIISRFPPGLRQYMEFTEEQVNQITRLNAALQRFQSDKGLRMATVHSELSVEMAKQTIDPMALGLRHLELESIRRELLAESNKTAVEIQKLLTPAQKTKVESLLQAIRLQGMICEAQAVNLLGSFPGNIIPADRWFDSPAFLIQNTCGFRSGDFGRVPTRLLP